ncbi:DUF3298 domain-containing protein [Luteimonas yindakuii]|uniref:RsiV family protein n=1 Tax=Luteimonas yindakuii TaxID=2565782 RepID=UPI0010A30A1C|nr:RsiV family protein [Luteimonas yindakuii]QCO67513.1 DUF3298 domain-containing protein [Luteimonas yindakuii]
MKYWWIGLAVLALAACGRNEEAGSAPSAAGVPQQETPSPEAPQPEPNLADVIEQTPRYIVGISYPPEARRYPGLASELHRYGQAARSELVDAAGSAGEAPGGLVYDLSLEFRMLVESPQLVAVAADGSSYTGGAHGNPLVARFVWLPQRERLLRAGDLVPEAEGWTAISRHVREQLHATLGTRIDAEELSPEARSEALRTAGRMIDDGSAPEPDNFDSFEPVLDPQGRIEALRFVFPPYQVGPYADGTQSVLVPAHVLLPHVAQEYRGLFSTATPADATGETVTPERR